MKLNDLIHTEIIAIDGFKCTTLQKETGKIGVLFMDDENYEVGDIIVYQVVEVGNTYGDQETYGTNIVEVIKKQDNMELDERFKYFLKVKDIVFKKLKEDSIGKKNMLSFILDDLQGVEKLYGLQMFFTTSDENELTEEEKNLIITSHALIIGDLMGADSNKVNDIVDNIIDQFYDFDKLRDGYLINQNFEEMESFIQKRIS